jgi:hypothetical protein
LKLDDVMTTQAGTDLLSLARLRDTHGVLSVYVDADPRQQAGPRPAWAIAIENGLGEIRERARSEGERPLWRALFDLLEGLEGELSLLLDPREPGRGRALFATVGAGEVHRIALQLPLPNRVVLDETAYLVPLVAALDRGRPAGLVTVSLPEARVFEQRLGVAEELAAFVLEPDTSTWRELKGPAAANPALPQHSAPQRDVFDRRVEEHRSRLLEAAGRRLEELAAHRAWEAAVVAGDPRLAQPLAELLERRGTEASLVERTLHGLSAAETAEALAPELEEATRRRAAALVARARDAALAGGPGALGLADVLGALEEGRVGHLLFEEGREHRGARAPGGRLVPEGVVPPGGAPDELRPEPRLTERMVERALATDASVTPVSEQAAEALAESDGVAAILRW